MQENFHIDFYSEKLNSAQQNYTTMEKELLSVVETAVYHRNVLLGFKINIHSNHKIFLSKTLSWSVFADDD